MPTGRRGRAGSPASSRRSCRLAGASSIELVATGDATRLAPARGPGRDGPAAGRRPDRPGRRAGPAPASGWRQPRTSARGRRRSSRTPGSVTRLRRTSCSARSRRWSASSGRPPSLAGAARRARVMRFEEAVGAAGPAAAGAHAGAEPRPDPRGLGAARRPAAHLSDDPRHRHEREDDDRAGRGRRSPCAHGLTTGLFTSPAPAHGARAAVACAAWRSPRRSSPRSGRTSSRS